YLSDYQNYADLAERFMQTKPASLIITHGYSGSGKSTASTRLAEQFGWIQLRSDVERQRLFASNQQNIYSTEKTAQTYQHLAKLASELLKEGFTVIVDATFLKQSQRHIFQDLASKQHVKFIILDVQASLEQLTQRISQRQNLGTDVSEATIAVLQQQLIEAEPLSYDEQQYVITEYPASSYSR
ncbi:partial gluconokinase, partial [Anaerolineae bacterium]